MPEALTPLEAKRLIDVVGSGSLGIRDRAYITLLFRCGLRNNECRMLDIADVKRSSASWALRVRFPKGIDSGRGKPRTIGIDPQARKILGAWIDRRGIAAGPLFVTRNGRRVETSFYRSKLKVVQKLAGVGSRVHPHALRHAFARQLAEEGVSMRIIQILLGHSRIETTAIYLQALGDPEAVAATDDREW